MPLAERQIQVRDLVMGPGTPYVVQETNPFTMTVRANQTGIRPWRDGSWSGAEFREERIFPLLIHAEAATYDAAGAMDLLHQFTAAFAPVGPAADDVECRFVYGGREYLMFGRPRSSEPDIAMLYQGQWSVSAAFVALDGHIYSGIEHVVSIGLPQFTGGLAVPFTVPVLVPARLSEGITTLTNEGITDTALRLRIDGPVLEPRVVLKRPDGVVQTLSISAALDAGQWLDIDTDAETVVLNGVADRLGDTSGAFPIAPPGTSVLRFFAAEYEPTAQLIARWRHAY